MLRRPYDPPSVTQVIVRSASTGAQCEQAQAISPDSTATVMVNTTSRARLPSWCRRAAPAGGFGLDPATAGRGPDGGTRSSPDMAPSSSTTGAAVGSSGCGPEAG